jgi:superfamily II DNA or RNA helicase
MNIDEILNGAKTAFINQHNNSSADFTPKLLYNNQNSKVINSLRDELRNCDEFIISSAFITMGGITPLLEEFRYLESNAIRGKILTTDYLNFTEPKALRKLNEFDNIEVKLYSQKKEGFHTKGYIFKKGDVFTGIVGSSNMTMNALSVNKEWNVEFTSLAEGEMLSNIRREFDSLWEDADSLDSALPIYEKIYDASKKFTDLRKTTKKLKENNIVLTPNYMQEQFLENIRNLISQGEGKAILVSATGTGKTYASAFAVKDFEPKRFLFLVHREQIAKQSIEAFKHVFPDHENFGLLSGNSKQYDKNYLFSTIQTMSKEDVYTRYAPDYFDYIIVDEVHKVGALSYLKVLDYFTPQFLLGMTASPERTDGFNIYDLFDNNIAHEIRLQEALEEDLLCPFHYFGITDVEFEDNVIDDDFTDFNLLASDRRVDYLIEKSEFYGYSGDRRKALVFCSRKQEAKLLSEEFNRRGYASIFLTGDDSQEKRLDAIDRLTNDDNPDKLEFIFTVDIFNEGVDIPEINQVLLVRPTESPIIFVQQLGRGLRKYQNKEYVVILDFIGNYKNNFMIPIALSGDRSYDKDRIRKYLMEGNKIIPGASSINFDEISKRRIFESINNTSFSRVALFKEKYNNLKFKLGKIPMLCDFFENGDMDPLLILNHNSFDAYINFLEKAEKDFTNPLGEEEINSLKFISKNLADGKRPHEIIMLKCLIYAKHFEVNKISDILNERHGLKNQFKSIESAINLLDLNFFTDNEKARYTHTSFFTENYEISDEFAGHLSNPTYRMHLEDVLNFALMRYESIYLSDKPLKLYEKYSRKDVCRLLNWPHDDSSTMYGYRVKHNTCPIFVTYEKNEDISESTKYEDQFVNKEVFSWMTRSRVRLDSKEAKAIINYQESGLKIHLFIKKSDDEGKDFYYMGEVTPISQRQTTIKDNKGNDLPIVNFKLKLDHSVEDEFYSYFVND